MATVYESGHAGGTVNTTVINKTIADTGFYAAQHKTYRGTNLGSVSSSTIDNFIDTYGVEDGTFDKLYLGDYFTATYSNTTIRFRIMDIDPYWEINNAPLNGKHHLLIVPDQILTSAQMNTSNTNSTGYYNSAMVKTTMPTIITNLTNIFGNHLLSFNEIVSSNNTTGTTTITTKAILMNEMEVFGTRTYSAINNGGAEGYLNYCLPGFLQLESNRIAYSGTTTQWWWERDCYSSNSSNFCGVSTSGTAVNLSGASNSFGVRPRFIIG